MVKREGKCMSSMDTGLLERLARADEPDANEEEYSKNAIASAYAGKYLPGTITRVLSH